MHLQRRTYSKSFKAQVIQECSDPGASIANIALGYSLNANLVHKWIRLCRCICVSPSWPSKEKSAPNVGRALCVTWLLSMGIRSCT